MASLRLRLFVGPHKPSAIVLRYFRKRPRSHECGVVAATMSSSGAEPHPSWCEISRRHFRSSRCRLNSSHNSHNGSVVDQEIIGDISNVTATDDQDRLGGLLTDIPGATNTQAKKLAIIYTCKVCDTRSAKQFTEQAYKHGVVLVRCPGCQNLHLIADRLGWFEDGAGEDGKGWDVEGALAKAGENVRAVTGVDVLELTLDDVMGKKAS